MSGHEKVCVFVEKYVMKPVVVFIAGSRAHQGKCMRHEGAIVSGNTSTVEEVEISSL